MREKKQKVAVISLKNGNKTIAKSLTPILNTITNKFKQVVFCPDMDSAGDVAVKDIRALFPPDFIVKVAEYSEKDSNDMILAGKTKELVTSCYNAGAPLTQGVVSPTAEMFEQLKKAPEFGISYPWPTLTKLTRGQRKGEVVYWGAAPKMGKSSIVNQLASWNVLEHKKRILLIKPEEQPLATLRRFAGALVGKVFHDPEIPVQEADVDRAMELMGDRVHIFDKWQTPKWSDTRQLMRQEVLGQGVEIVYLDPLTNFTVGMSGSERNDFLITMTRELAEDAANYGFTAHVFCHFNKAPKGDKQWNAGRVPSSDDFQGSSAMAQACHMMIGVQGYKVTDGEDKEYLNGQRVLHILEEREYGVSDSIPLQWYGSQGRLKEIDNE
jgi:twinkle protein